jgi:hypothetical protein
MGMRLKVLALVWISGMLELIDNKRDVEHVIQVAIEQRRTLDSDPALPAMMKESILMGASLFNRQVLTSGLLGVTSIDKSVEADILKASGIKWQERKLAGYKAVLNEFERPAQSGIMAPDHSAGTVSVKYASPLSDAKFADLVKRIDAKQ